MTAATCAKCPAPATTRIGTVAGPGLSDGGPWDYCDDHADEMRVYAGQRYIVLDVALEDLVTGELEQAVQQIVADAARSATRFVVPGSHWKRVRKSAIGCANLGAYRASGNADDLPRTETGSIDTDALKVRNEHVERLTDAAVGRMRATLANIEDTTRGAAARIEALRAFADRHDERTKTA